MSEIAGRVAESPAPRGADPPGVGARTERWRRPPVWLWGALVPLQILCAALLTSKAFFFLDDYVFLNEARTESFTLGYLRKGLYEHFSPISRVLDKLLVELAPGSFVLAHAVELALYACALIAFAFVVRTILGNSWSAFVFTILFGQSIFLIRLLFWWTITANVLPATIFSLLSIGCYLRWRAVGSRRWLAGSFVAFVVALLDYETAMLVPAYIALISLLVLEPRLSPRAWAASLWRERWAWAVYLALDVAALANYYAFYYRPTAQPSIAASAHFLAIALFDTFVPTIAGIDRPNLSLASDPLALVAGLVAVAVALYLRPRAWRCLVAFIVVFPITMLPVGLNRVVHYGVAEGRVLYYQQAVQFMFLVLAALAVSTRWGGQRVRPAVGTPKALGSGTRAAASWRASRPVLAAVVVGPLAVYAALYLTSLHALRNKTWQASRDRAYLNTYLASVKRVTAASGHAPALVDLTVPTDLLPKGLRPFNTYGEFLALFNPQLRVDEIANPVYVVSPEGRLQPVALDVSTSAVLDKATVDASSASGAGTAAWSPGGSRACVPSGRSTSWLRVPLASAQRMSAQTSDLPYALRARFTMPASSTVVMLLASLGGRGFATVTRTWDRGSGGELIPLGFTGELSQLDFRLPARACITALAVGRLVHIHGS